MDQFKKEMQSKETINKLCSLDSEVETLKKALNQLILSIVGSKYAIDTHSLESQPKERIKRCTELVMIDYAEAQSLLQECVPDSRRMLAEVQRRLDSLSSLSTIDKPLVNKTIGNFFL